MGRVAYDLIQMAEGYNSDNWISHFRDCFTCMDSVFTHRKKSQAVNIVESFFNMIETRYKRKILYFRTDGERSLGKSSPV
jgi:hypothetical protein